MAEQSGSKKPPRDRVEYLVRKVARMMAIQQVCVRCDVTHPPPEFLEAPEIKSLVEEATDVIEMEIWEWAKGVIDEMDEMVLYNNERVWMN